MSASLKQIRESLGYESFDDFLVEWRKLTPDERAKLQREVSEKLASR